MALAGVDHITISPQLLQKLIETPASEKTKASLFDGEIEIPPMLSFTNEPEYRIAFTLSGKGEGERKLTQVSVLRDIWRLMAHYLFRLSTFSARCRPN